MSAHPGLPDVLAARERIRGRVVHTPLLASSVVPVMLKLECRQETGSFKLRGATNRLLALSKEETARGVVAVSSGNHGRAVAKIAADLGVTAVICLSSRVPAFKVDAIRSLGARVVVAGPDQDDADAEARRLVAEEGLTFVHPFDDPLVIAGQGTTALEILDDAPATDLVVVPMSGGGLIGGIAAAAKGIDPEIKVVGVSQDLGPAMYLSIRAGHLVGVVEEDTLADALAGGLGPENHHSYEMCRDLVDESVLVTEDEIAAAMAALYRSDGLVVEGGGAVGVAAILAGKIEPTANTVVVISGGNVGREALEAVMNR
ncbi:MAG: pyridoxal-phosphate dependent enzyme [Acidimicrobiia bacterium]|nr:pyridoxal-phosphate dependent enzyme [Acidimicrobiia bacterium]